MIIKIISKKYEEKNSVTEVLRKINIEIKKGEFCSLYGPNASGKTTFLKIVAGLHCDFDGNVIFDEKIEKKGFIFQNYKESLFPWMDNLDNISYFSLLKGVGKKERYKEVKLFIDKYDLQINLAAYPYQQSGGQQQLTSVLRAMIYHPQLLIMDEPFSSLDQRLRAKMIVVIQKYWQEFKPTIIFVSHDLDESILLAEEIVVMRKIREKEKDSILAKYHVPFERLREAILLESISFFSLKSNILSTIRKDFEDEKTN